jgi:ribosomal protein S18 acetylase RimI-like enzyme
LKFLRAVNCHFKIVHCEQTPQMAGASPALPTADGLLVRNYVRSDSAACLRLEISGSELRFGGGLVSAAFWHHQAFDAKARQFFAHILLVCEDPEKDNAVCGVIAVAIKRLWAHGEDVLCGYVFDLRVDSSYRRRGIGLQLAHAVERRAAALGVSYMYLSVNGSNKVAIHLYSRMGFVHASHRSLLFRPLVLPARASSRDAAAAAAGGGVRQLSAAEACDLVSSYYAKRDLGLSRREFERLFASPNLLATFAATDAPAGAGNTSGVCSTAVLVLWNGSTLTGFKVVRFFLPVSLWSRLAPLLPVALALLFAAELGLLWAGYAATSLSTWACAGAAVATAITFGLYLWASSRTAFRARVFAPVAEGPEWEPLMRAVYSAAHAEARSRGFAAIVINADEDSAVVRALVGPTRKAKEAIIDAPPAFMQKRLGVGAGGEQPGPLAPDSFFDPRDI